MAQAPWVGSLDRRINLVSLADIGLRCLAPVGLNSGRDGTEPADGLRRLSAGPIL